MNQISFFIWNIHGMQGYKQYKMPDFVINKILEEDKDLVIITEFIRTTNWRSESRKLAKKYWRYTYPISSIDSNEVLILIKKGFNKIDNNLLKSLKPHMLPYNSCNPNFLQVIINLNENSRLYVIGLRIRDDIHKIQYQLLDNYLNSLNLNENDYILCGGDFNEWNKCAQQKITHLKVHTPKVVLGNNPFPKTSAKDSSISTWSVVLKDKNNITGKALIDHVATKNITDITLDNYCWGFVSSCNGYFNRLDFDYKSDLLYLPDHAILKGKIHL